MESVCRLLCVLILVLPAVIGSQIAALNGDGEAQELASSASEQGRFLVNAIMKSTTTTTFSSTTTISTVYFCVKKTYACGGGKRKRRDLPVINEAQYEAEMEQAVDIIPDLQAREIVKREARGFNHLNLARVGGFKWIPSPVQAEEVEEEAESPIIEKRSVPKDDAEKGRFFNLITLVATVSSTSTSTTTTTLGTVAITGTTSQCPSGSITDYLSTCG